MNGKPTSRIRVLVVVFVLIVLAALLLAVSHSWQQTVQVRTAFVTYQDLSDPVSTNGQVEPILEFQAHAATSGIVEKLYVSLNQKVSAGQLLIRMEDADAEARLAASRANLTAAEAVQQDQLHGGSQDERNAFQGDLERAQVSLQDAKKALVSAQNLEATGAASPSEVAQVQQRVNLAQANVDAIQRRMTNRYSAADLAHSRAQVADAEAAVRAAGDAISHADIRSPIAGTVYSRSASQYDYVEGGGDLLKVADLSHLRVRAYFDEPDIGKLAVGQPAIIAWEAMPGRVWHGHVAVTPTTVKTYTTRHVGEGIITVDDADGELKPYANVTVTVTTQQLHHVLVIPHEALRTQAGSNFVFLVRNGKLVRAPIQVGISNYTQIQVTGGLAEGQQIALGAVSNLDLTEGMRVTAVNETHE